MGAVADALAALHGAPVPPAADRPPLPDTAGPAAALADLVERQSAALSAAGAVAAVRRLVAAEVATARHEIERRSASRQPVCLVGTDTHPGNFLIDPEGRAVLVDLDKALYGAPAVDLAHASLGTSIFWATGDWRAFPADARQRFKAGYLAALPADLAAATGSWLAPLTRLTWLRTTTWAATWRTTRLPVLQDLQGLKDVVARADQRTAALLEPENVEREAALLPAWNAEEPA